MTIYKIFMIIQERKRGGKILDVDRKEKIVVDNLDRAKEVYQEMKNDAECWFQYSKYLGRVTLFIPTIHSNGELGYWGEIIEEHEKKED